MRVVGSLVSFGTLFLFYLYLQTISKNQTLLGPLQGRQFKVFCRGFTSFACMPPSANGIIDAQCGVALTVPRKGGEAGKKVRFIFAEFAAAHFMGSTPVMPEHSRYGAQVIIPPREAISQTTFDTHITR